MGGLVFYLAFVGTFAFISYRMAVNRGRDPLPWVIAAFVVPIFVVPILAWKGKADSGDTLSPSVTRIGRPPGG